MQRLLEAIPPGITRIDLLAPPFAGHLHPVLAMGRQLAAHYEVRIISTRGAAARIRSAELSALILEGDFDTPLQAVVNPQYAVKSDPIKLYRQFRAVVGLLNDFADRLDTLWKKEGPPYLAIVDFTLPVVGVVCKRFGITWWSSLPSPCVLETPDGVPAYCGGLMPPSNRIGRFSQFLHRKKVRIFKSMMFWLFRNTIRQTGITQLYRQDGSESAYSADCILALSEKGFEFPRSWPQAVTFIGPALYTPPVVHEGPCFIAGKRHVLITLGTHLGWHKPAVMKALRVLAASLPEWVFHFTEGYINGDKPQHEGNLSRVSWVDYDRDLILYDAVIHHGGAGIMWHCLQKKIPTLVYPVDFDQLDHAARLAYHNKGIWIRGGISELEKVAPLLEKIVERPDER